MEEKDKLIIDDDDLEILDFDDDIIDESPEIEEIIIEDIPQKSTNEIPTIEEEIVSTEPIKAEEPQLTKEDINSQLNDIEEISNTDLLNKTLNIDNNVQIETNIIEEPKKEIFVDEKILTEQSKTKKREKKSNNRLKTTLIGVLIFIILTGVIIALPFISSFVNSDKNNKQENNTNNNSATTQEFKSNIDVKKALEDIKEYKNYQYQNMNIISTKDNTEQLVTIKNNYIYSFNETKFEIAINKTVADFTYELKDYYEKLDDVYNLYINDVTTNTYTKRNTTVDEFNKLSNVFPSMIDYLINNYNLHEEKLLKIGNEEHIDITLKVSKDIVNNMSVETDRVQNKIDCTKLEQDYIYVDLLFDEDNKLYKIEIEIEDANAAEEQIENTIETAILRYIFTDFNKTVDITLPSL